MNDYLDKFLTWISLRLPKEALNALRKIQFTIGTNFWNTLYSILPLKKEINLDGLSISVEKNKIRTVEHTKVLAVMIHPNLSWQSHIKVISSKIAKPCGIIIKSTQLFSNTRACFCYGKWSFFGTSVFFLVVKNPYDLRSQIRFRILWKKNAPFKGTVSRFCATSEFWFLFIPSRNQTMRGE